MSAPRLLSLALMAAMPLVSCRIVGDRADFSGMGDVFTPAQDDNVVVEGKPAVSTTLVAEPRTTRAATPAGGYTVCPGDTLSAIARRHGVSLAALKDANGLSGTDPVIRPGQVLRLPGQAATPTAPKPAAPKPTAQLAAAGTYTMRPGDTLSAVARQHGVSLEALLKANELTQASARFVQPGATITIPSKH